MVDIVARRITGELGVVNDTRYLRCFWPPLDKPTALFAKGSSGLSVMGPPTPRNVVFPPDTTFLDAVPDAFYPAEVALFAAFPTLRGLVNLTDEQAAFWLAAYNKAAAEQPAHATRLSTRADCHFFRKGTP